MTAPVNDARVMIVCIGYGESLCLFMIAFLLVTKLKSATYRKKIIMRIISLILLVLSYLRTESLLVFTGLIWLYLLYCILQNNTSFPLATQIERFILSASDYILIPFIVFISKSTIIPKLYGKGADYKAISVHGLLTGLLHSPLTMIRTGVYIGYSYYSRISILSIAVFVIVSVVYILYKRNLFPESVNARTLSRKHDLIMLGLGCITYYAGGFAYVVFHEGRMDMIRNVSVGGRDAILLGFGLSIMIYYFMKIIPVPLYIRNPVFISLIVLGTFHFTEWYLNYQEDWFQQLEFAQIIKSERYMPDDDTILVDYSYPSECDGRRSSTLNALYQTITGHQDKYFIDNSTGWATPEQISANKLEFNCLDYDSTDTTIDGIILINNRPITNPDIIKLRLDELFNKNSFNQKITNLTNGKYIPITAEASNMLYEMHENDSLSSETLREILKQ